MLPLLNQKTTIRLQPALLIAALLLPLSASSPADDVPAAPAPAPAPAVNATISRIAFGSCSTQDEPQGILRTVLEWKPELFIYMGDNIYGDTRDMRVLQQRYDTLGRRPEFQQLRAAVPLIATWDDHDYGENDAGREYPLKKESKEIFLKFWNESLSSPRRSHEGIYTSYRFGEPGSGRCLQIILLDTRTFRDSLFKSPQGSWKNDYLPDTDPQKTLLGAAQWEWLKERLQEPADLRIIGSSIQFAHEHNGWESWTNLPHELLRMVELIRQTRAEGVLFISGDVHWGELSRLQAPNCYPLYDLTASGLNQDWDRLEPNGNRLGDACMDFHFGMLEINWGTTPSVELKIHDMTGRARVRRTVRFSELRFSGR